MKHYLRFMLVLLLSTVWCVGGYSQVTVKQSIFESTSANSIDNDKNVSYSTAKGGGTANPRLANNQIYLYQKASGEEYGGTITIKVASGCTLKSVTIGSSMATKVAYTVDNATSLSASNSIKANGKFTVKDLSASSITFYCMGTTTGTRLYVNFLSVTYTSPAPTTATFGPTVDNKTFTIIKGDEFPQYTAKATNKNGEEVVGKFEYTSSNDSYVTVDKTTGQTAAGTEFGEAVITAKFIPTDAAAYKSSSASYSIDYRDNKASLIFSESTATVVYGKESEFVAPTLSLVDAKGNEVKGQTIMYGVTPTTGIVEIDENTGEIKNWIKPGTATIEALVLDGEYENLSATYTLNYEKANTTIEFAEGEHSVDINKAISVKAIVKANDTEVADLKPSYSSSSDEIATVDVDGKVTGVAAGKVTITASFKGNDYYNGAPSATYDVSVIDPNNITVFYESFDKANPDGKGGTDNDFSNGSGDFDYSCLDNSGWTYSGTVQFAKQCLKIGASKNKASITTPALNKLDGDAVLTFKLAPWKGDDSTVKLSVIGTGSININSFIPASDKWTSYSVNIKGGNSQTKLKFECTSGKNRFFLDEVKITATKSEQAESITLTEDNNKGVISAANGKTCNVTLDRKMDADGAWYTFCVPFDIENIATTPLKDAEIRKYKSMTGTTMNFEPTTSLKAMHAYLVKPTSNIVNPEFEDVLVVSEKDKVTDGEKGFEFVGICSKHTLALDGTNLFLGANNTFYIPTPEDYTLKALRGYFVVPEGTSASKMGINIDGETTSISTLNTADAINGKVYNLNGQYVGNNVKTLQKGIYVVNGKKIIVK